MTPSDPEAQDLSILVGQDGSVRAVAATDWPLASLAAEHGARLAYRVIRAPGKVRVEGRSSVRTVVLEAEIGGRPRRVIQTLVPALC